MSGSTSTQIVNVLVSEQVAAAPSKRQNTGAIISLGATNLTTGTYALLTQASDLTPLLTVGAGNATEVLAKVTTFYAQGSAPVYVLELGVNATEEALATWITATPKFFYAYSVPAAWDLGTATQVASVTITDGGTGYTTGTTAMFSTAGTGGTTATGTVTVSNGVITAVEITNPGYYPSGSITVTFSGTGTAATGTVVTSLAWIGFLNEYTSTTAQTYFFTRTATSSLSQYSGESIKSALVLIEAPAAPATEDTVTAAFFKAITYSPSSVNKVTQMAFSYLFDVTAYPTQGNAALLSGYATDNINYIDTGAEGGITNTILKFGTMLDGNDFSVWWETDWIAIQAEQALANAVINGSNNPQAPLEYAQSGIDSLLAVVQQVVTNGVNWGIINPNQPIILTAIPFTTYVTANPGNYSKGIYNGLALTCTPQRGFRSITFNLTVQF